MLFVIIMFACHNNSVGDQEWRVEPNTKLTNEITRFDTIWLRILQLKSKKKCCYIFRNINCKYKLQDHVVYTPVQFFCSSVSLINEQNYLLHFLIIKIVSSLIGVKVLWWWGGGGGGGGEGEGVL